MDTLYALVDDPNKFIVVEHCDHKHRQFRNEHYDYECQRCGLIFDDDKTMRPSVVL